MNLKNAVKFFRKYYIILLFAACILLVAFVVLIKSVLAESTYVYVKVKVGQNSGITNTEKATLWHLNSIKKGDTSKDLFGHEVASILGKYFYRSDDNIDQYDTYLILRLKTTYNQNSATFYFNKLPLSVGSAIELQFPRGYFTGTIIDISAKPIKDVYVDKIVYLAKRNAFPWEYNAIKIGDKASNGEETYFEILDKSMTETTNITSDSFGNMNPNIIESRGYIIVKAKAKLKKVNDKWVVCEDREVIPGRELGMSVSNFVFGEYIVIGIE